MHTLLLISFMTPEVTSTMTRVAGEMPSEDTQQLAEACPAPRNSPSTMRPFALKETGEAGPSTSQGEQLPAMKGTGLHRIKWHHNIYLKASKTFKNLFIDFFLKREERRGIERWKHQ